MTHTVELMRKRVLDMAIRGELVEQQSEEGDAKNLINSINEEKERLISEKVLRKTNLLDAITEEEIPFSIPEKWSWIRLGEISYNYDSKRKPVSLKDRVDQDKIYPYYGATGEIDQVENYLFDGLYLLIGEDGGNFFTSKDNAFLVQGKFWANNHVHVLQYLDLTLTQYMKHFMNALDLPEMGLINGIAVPKLNQTNLNNIIVPLPPLAEQKRIVAKIEDIFAVIDQIGTKKEEALSIIRNMRQTAIKDAIMGVLVEQDETDEPASELYEKIKNEKEKLVKEKKIKKEKPLPEIEENETPFEIPKSWRWTRLGDLGFFKKGPFGSALTKSIFVEDSLESIKVYEQKNAIQSDCTLGEYFITKDYYEEKMVSNTVMPGDIIVSCAGTIGKSYIIPDGARLGIINQALMRIRVYTINKQYFRLIFNHVIQTDGAQGKGSAIKNIPPMKVLNNLLVPLPPLAEQERIVEKINEIMAICDQMEAIFDGTSEVNEALEIAE